MPCAASSLKFNSNATSAARSESGRIDFRRPDLHLKAPLYRHARPRDNASKQLLLPGHRSSLHYSVAASNIGNKPLPTNGHSATIRQPAATTLCTLMKASTVPPSSYPANSRWSSTASVAVCIAAIAAVAFLCPSAATAAAAAIVPPPVPAALVTNGLGSILVGVGTCVAAVAFAILVFFSIPMLLAMRRAAVAVALLSRTAEVELPDTVAALRLGSLELTDAMGEMSLLGSDLTKGVRASAAGIQATREGLLSGGAAARSAVTEAWLPAARSKAPALRDAAQAVLQERAQLQRPQPDIRAAAHSAKQAVKQARAVVAGATLSTKISALASLLRNHTQQTADGNGGRDIGKRVRQSDDSRMQQ